MKRIFISMIMAGALIGMTSCACSNNSADEQAPAVECTASDCAGCEDAGDSCVTEPCAGCDSTAVKDTSYRR